MFFDSGLYSYSEPEGLEDKTLEDVTLIYILISIFVCSVNKKSVIHVCSCFRDGNWGMDVVVNHVPVSTKL
jgi:hypothetical protein